MVNFLLAALYLGAIGALAYFYIKHEDTSKQDKKEEPSLKKITIDESEMDNKHAQEISKYLMKTVFFFLKVESKQKEHLEKAIADSIVDYVKIKGK